ncbi:MAG: hypothetical protein JO299_04795, partial [Gammaproteobacteria bacterium]|nr:hypothetical protein [Gammaproteobacteria bacterium]
MALTALQVEEAGFRNPRRYPIQALAGLLTGACLASLAAQLSANAQPDPVSACTNLARLINFPVTSTRITRAQFIPPGINHMLRDGTKFETTSLWLPGHCRVQGIINARTGTDGFQYGDMFEVRLPTQADWNGRFMFQGGGGTEGSLPPATGSAGTLSPTLAHGWA